MRRLCLVIANREVIIDYAHEFRAASRKTYFYPQTRTVRHTDLMHNTQLAIRKTFLTSRIRGVLCKNRAFQMSQGVKTRPFHSMTSVLLCGSKSLLVFLSMAFQSRILIPRKWVRNSNYLVICVIFFNILILEMTSEITVQFQV